MKHFSMPEQVSPTLEIDELMRLKHSLEKNVSREVAESKKFKFINMVSLHCWI